MYRYEFSAKAQKEFLKLEKDLQFRIIEKLDYITNTPNPLIYCEHLTNFSAGQFRLRVGVFRIVFDMEDDVLVILKIGHRREIYR